MADKKTCYIISQIGKPDSQERKWSNFVREHIITPIVTDCGYEVPARADDPDKGLITPDIIEQMFVADLVIADLTGENPNVFYELGIRHCAQKPVIHLIKTDQSPPFDLGDNKAIPIDELHKTVIQAKSDIGERIKDIENNPKQFHSQVQIYIQLKQLKLLETGQTGREDVLIELLKMLMQSVGLQSGMLQQLHKELIVEKPKLTPLRSLAASYLAEEYNKERLRQLGLERVKRADLLREQASEEDEQKQ